MPPKPRLPPLLTHHHAKPHPSLHLLPSFLTPSAQQHLLAHSLALLSSPSQTTSHARKLARQWRQAHPAWNATQGFMGSEAYEWQEGHFDGVIEGYREMLVRGGKWDAEDELLRKELGRLYELLPAPKAGEEDAPTPPTRATADPPDHLLMHVLHLAPHGHIRPHVDNKEAFGRTIVGLSLGGERVMRFCRAKEGEEDRAGAGEGPDEFDVLLRPGDVYVQSEPLRTHYTHEVLHMADWDGRQVGGTQRLSIMLRDKLPVEEGSSSGATGTGMGAMSSK